MFGLDNNVLLGLVGVVVVFCLMTNKKSFKSLMKKDLLVIVGLTLLLACCMAKSGGIVEGFDISELFYALYEHVDSQGCNDSSMPLCQNGSEFSINPNYSNLDLCERLLRVKETIVQAPPAMGGISEMISIIDGQCGASISETVLGDRDTLLEIVNGNLTAAEQRNAINALRETMSGREILMEILNGNLTADQQRDAINILKGLPDGREIFMELLEGNLRGAEQRNAITALREIPGGREILMDIINSGRGLRAEQRAAIGELQNMAGGRDVLINAVSDSGLGDGVAVQSAAIRSFAQGGGNRDDFLKQISGNGR